nr:D446 [uncultured bacterium]
MILKHQAKDDPHIREAQYRGILEVVDELNEQGNRLGINVESRITVQEIGQHVVTRERIAA